MLSTSNVRTFNPNLGEIVIGAFSRCGIRRTEITTQHMADAEFEANLLQSDMQGDGIILNEVVLQSQDLLAGVSAYAIDPTMVFMLDVYIRQNAMPYGVMWANDNGAISRWENAVNGILSWGPSPGYTPYNKDGSVMEPIPPVPPVAPPPIQQNAIDRIIMPISRSDYASISNKGQGGFPTSYWLDRLLQPVMYIWPVPQQDIPNGLQYYIQQRPQNAALINGSLVQVPYEAKDYYVWALAERLAYIYAPDKLAMISPAKQAAYQKYLQSGTENVPINMDTQLGSYFRIG